ncbi:MAG: glycosyltransferase [Desulfuromonadaceae bacterium]|nr:glycosyltransferase [Desulfuromonadaceae bacterium]
MNKNLVMSVIIPTYRDWARLALCLDALRGQTLSPDRFEIIVVNNDPADVLPPGYAFPVNATLLTEVRPGSYAARNRGVSASKGDILAFTDADCQPRPDWLASVLRCLEEHQEVTRIGGKVELMLPTDQALSAVQMYEKVFGFRQQDYVKEQGMAATANMIARRSVFDLVGEFDEGLMSGGDAEWGLRAQRAGSKIIYCDDCVVHHPPRASFAAVVQKSRREVGGQFQLNADAPFAARLVDVLSGFLPPLRSIGKVLFNKNFTLRERSIAIGLRYVLRVIVHGEKALLLLSLKKVERV